MKENDSEKNAEEADWESDQSYDLTNEDIDLILTSLRTGEDVSQRKDMQQPESNLRSWILEDPTDLTTLPVTIKVVKENVRRKELSGLIKSRMQLKLSQLSQIQLRKKLGEKLE